MEFGAMTNEGLIRLSIRAPIAYEEGMALAFAVAELATDEVYNWATWEGHEGMVPFRTLEVYKTPNQWEVTEADIFIGSILR